MDEKDWMLLQILHEEKNITRTAERLFISQPALTYRLQQIEKEFDAQLFVRGKKGIEFTDQGEYLVKHAREMVTLSRKIKDAVKSMEGKVKGTLRVGSSNNFARFQLPKLLKNFLAQYPEVEIHVKTGWSSNLLQFVSSNEVHVGIVRGDFTWHGEKHLLKEEEICIASKNELDLSELPRLPRIHYKTDPHLQLTIDSWWQSQFSEPPLITMEVDRIETCRELVRNGLGYGIFPEISLDEKDDLWTHPLHINGQPVIRKTWLIYHKDNLNVNTVRAFVEFLKNRSAV